MCVLLTEEGEPWGEAFDYGSYSSFEEAKDDFDHRFSAELFSGEQMAIYELKSIFTCPEKRGDWKDEQ